MKRILQFLVIVMVAIICINFYFGRQIEKQLDTASQFLTTMGGHFSYRNVGVTLVGNVQVKDVTVFIPGMGESLHIDQVIIGSESILGIYSIARDFREKRMPEHVNWKIKGAQLTVGGEAFKHVVSISQQDQDFLLPSCGEKTSLDYSDFTQMGYGNGLKADFDLDIRIFNNGQWMEMMFGTFIEGVYESNVKIDVTVNASSRDLSVISASGVKSELNELIVDYKDLGYVSRYVEFCQKESRTARSEFLTYQAELWKNIWKQYGLIAGDRFVGHYRQFLEDPQTFRLSVKPNSTFDLESMAGASPDLILYQFDTSLHVNGEDKGPLDLLAMTSAQKATWKAEQESLIAPLAVSEPPESEELIYKGPIDIAVEDLKNFNGKQVLLGLDGGGTIKGIIISSDEDGMLVYRYQSGGSMETEVSYNQVVSAKLIPVGTRYPTTKPNKDQ